MRIIYSLRTSDFATNTSSVKSVLPPILNDLEANFFETVSEECWCDHIIKFIDVTGNDATAMATCTSCAGNFFICEMYEMKVLDLKTKNALAPSKPHPAQKLMDGMLLHMTLSSHCCNANGVIFVNLCNSCMLDLKRNKTPKLLLANGMWIRDIPLELKVLTLPECILVTCYFPVAYIVKLYPTKKGPVTGHHCQVCIVLYKGTFPRTASIPNKLHT